MKKKFNEIQFLLSQEDEEREMENGTAVAELDFQ